jgi:hypothetical protein
MRVARLVLSALFLIAIFRIPSALAQTPVTPDLEEGQATTLEVGGETKTCSLGWTRYR